MLFVRKEHAYRVTTASPRLLPVPFLSTTANEPEEQTEAYPHQLVSTACVGILIPNRSLEKDATISGGRPLFATLHQNLLDKFSRDIYRKSAEAIQHL